jgi:hypothetical protein
MKLVGERTTLAETSGTDGRIVLRDPERVKTDSRDLSRATPKRLGGQPIIEERSTSARVDVRAIEWGNWVLWGFCKDCVDWEVERRLVSFPQRPGLE